MVSDFLPRTVSKDGGREVKVAVPRSDNRSGVVLRLLPGAFTRLAAASWTEIAVACHKIKTPFALENAAVAASG